MTWPYDTAVWCVMAHIIYNQHALQRGWVKIVMKQLDVVVSPPAFLWDPYLTLTHVIFDLDICNF